MFLSLSQQFVTPIQSATSALSLVLANNVRKLSLPVLKTVSTKECDPEHENKQAGWSPLLSNQSLQSKYFILFSSHTH